MHAFYEENKPKFKKTMDTYLRLIAPELSKETGVPYPTIFEKAWQYYEKNLLEYFPYVGGNKVSGTKNLTGCYYYVALGEIICREYGVPLETWGFLVTTSYQRYFDKIPKFLRKIMGKLFQKPKFIYKMLRKKDAKNEKNARKNPGSFETSVMPPTEDYPVIYHTTVCPIANFAKEHGYLAYMPYLCNLDYVMFGAMNVPLYRENTCADGDGYCDFKLKKGAPVVPAWPCHSNNPEDPLK